MSAEPIAISLLDAVLLFFPGEPHGILLNPEHVPGKAYRCAKVARNENRVWLLRDAAEKIGCQEYVKAADMKLVQPLVISANQ